jgi:hypothetical protein
MLPLIFVGYWLWRRWNKVALARAAAPALLAGVR